MISTIYSASANKWFQIAATVWLLVFTACAETHHEEEPPQDVMAAALVGWSYAGFEDPRDFQYNKVSTLQFRQAETREIFNEACNASVKSLAHLVVVREDRVCIYWTSEAVSDGGAVSYPVIVTRDDVEVAERLELELHGVLHYFIYCVTKGGLVDSHDSAHDDQRVWGADGAEEVGRWEL